MDSTTSKMSFCVFLLAPHELVCQYRRLSELPRRSKMVLAVGSDWEAAILPRLGTNGWGVNAPNCRKVCFPYPPPRSQLQGYPGSDCKPWKRSIKRDQTNMALKCKKHSNGGQATRTVRLSFQSKQKDELGWTARQVPIGTW